jgi:hypothetical protein
MIDLRNDERMLDFEIESYQKIKRKHYDPDEYYIVKKKATSKRRQNRKIRFEEEIDEEEY